MYHSSFVPCGRSRSVSSNPKSFTSGPFTAFSSATLAPESLPDPSVSEVKEGLVGDTGCAVAADCALGIVRCWSSVSRRCDARARVSVMLDSCRSSRPFIAAELPLLWPFMLAGFWARSRAEALVRRIFRPWCVPFFPVVRSSFNALSIS